MREVSAIVLAGGLGTRLRSVVSDVPKPMAPVNGRPFLEYQLEYWIRQGINRFVLSVGYQHEVIIDYFGNKFKGAKLDYVIEEIPLGTGGGFLLAAQKIDMDEPFLLLNGDTYFEVNLSDLMKFSMANDADWCFSLFRNDQNGRYLGMEVLENGRISSLKPTSVSPSPLANGGVYLVHPRSLTRSPFTAGCKVSLEDEIFPDALAFGQRLFGMEFTGSFIDIGVPDDFYRASFLIM